ncbi:hypothetical protein K2173_009305 [Erythroxylum novogranatense]|uniref:Uncharacterized protein n=1 Tax=Erythroxylum novogranatense TaxID=1862640 RepID=A0AAV8U6R5_9ROSI|nr:hypothetical protein K2173_009305 [Erythroxylum novogranatense]
MVRPPCCTDANLKKGPWMPEEDEKLVDYISSNGHGNWKQLPKLAGLNRCGKSCRLRWTNYLRPDIKRGTFTDEEERVIINLHSVIGNKWSRIAAHLPGRTDNEIKNFWNTHIRKKLLQMGIDPNTHKPRTDLNHLMNLSQLVGTTQLGGNLFSPWSNILTLQADVSQLAKLQLLQNVIQMLSTTTLPSLDYSTLLGSRGVINGEKNLRTEGLEANIDSLLNATVNPFPSNDFQAVPHPSEGILDHESLNNSLTSTSYEKESLLPKLASTSASPESSTVNQMESNSEPLNHRNSSSDSSVFEAWEKILDDETDGSYWKDILDQLTSSSPSWPLGE